VGAADGYFAELEVLVLQSLEHRFPQVKFYNPNLTEIQSGVEIGMGSRVGSMTLVHTGARIGQDCTIGSHCNICKVTIGNRVSIQTGCHITNGVIVEDDVFIGPGVVTLNDKLTGEGWALPKICVGAKIGGGSVILPGVVIGAGAIVGAGSVVTKHVPPGATVVGNPAKILS
jgi:UDP-2-acetamido-3-amino-2,3-dideoxy-glucuronate N-acetyltransferase